ncbi:MAG: AAA family ATPase [Lachnospiraceae bacterium]
MIFENERILAMAQAYSNQQLYHIAFENYHVLEHFCGLLEQEGYWEEAGRILHLSSKQLLDRYVQSLLVCFAAYCNRLHREECEFIAALSEFEKDKFLSEEPDIGALVEQSERFQKNPPILFQLLSLRDIEKESGTAGLVFDAVLNIMLCLSYLNGRHTAMATRYFGIYFDRISMFLQNRKNPRQAVDSKYIFKKLCFGELEKSGAELLASDYSFEAYKKKHLFYREEQMETVQTAQIEHGTGKLPEQEDGLSEKTESETEKNQKSEAASEDEMSSESETAVKNESIILDTVREDKLNTLLEELDGLVGLKEVKTEIRSLINLIKVRKMREKYGLPEIEMSYHMVFTGSPGTGKTTVARLVGKIYKELGILSKGTMTETDRSGLVAGYVGQTALKVKEVVEKALGGVLFIDEAYALSSSVSNDFGSEAIDTLVKLMEDHREDLVVIVAGYTEEMKQFLKANTGLISRFNRFIPFPDYSEEELLDILQGMAKKAGLRLEEGVSKRLKDYLLSMPEKEKREFGNARGIRNIFETLVVNQANRIVALKNLSVEQLTLVKEEDMAWLAENKQ